MKTYLKPLLILLPVIALAVYFLTHQSKKSEFSDEDRKQAVLTAQAYGTLDMKEFKDWKGKTFLVWPEAAPVVVVHFWASWCAPCIHEFPELIEMVKKSNGKVIVVAISEDSDESEIRAFLKSFPQADKTENFRIVWDKDRSFMKQFDAGKLPESFIYGPDRKLAKRVAGAISWVTPESLEYMKILAEKKAD